MSIVLRPYQHDVVNDVRKAYAEGYKCPLVVAATGSGKTVMFSYIAKNAADKNNTIINMFGIARAKRIQLFVMRQEMGK